MTEKGKDVATRKTRLRIVDLAEAQPEKNPVDFSARVLKETTLAKIADPVFWGNGEWDNNSWNAWVYESYADADAARNRIREDTGRIAWVGVLGPLPWSQPEEKVPCFIYADATAYAPLNAPLEVYSIEDPPATVILDPKTARAVISHGSIQREVALSGWEKYDGPLADFVRLALENGK